MRWTVYTRVVDNFGDIGFSWRLAADLAARGEAVRLAVDDASALAWMAPDGRAGVTVVPWQDAGVHTDGDADVLVETFGAGIPDEAAEAAGRAPRLPVHIDVEHLSAEPFTLRSHGLASPRTLDDGRSFPRWFFFPGFVAGSGGLVRERDLLRSTDAFERDPWLASQGIVRHAGERVVSLFGYEQPALGPMLGTLASFPTLLLLSPGAAGRAAQARVSASPARALLRAEPLPFLSQTDYDRMLASCDLAFVRGEDSPVRAIWAGVPFVWQLYPQDDGAQAAKLAAFLDIYLADADDALARDVRAAFTVWNGLVPVAAWPVRRFVPGPLFDAWSGHAAAARAAFAAQPDLASQLVGFATARR